MARPAPPPTVSAHAARLIREAAAFVERAGPQEEEAVHRVRVTIKRMRSLWRLLRPLVGRELAGRENQRLRAAAGRLASHRDDDVALQTLRALERQGEDGAVQALCERARAAVETARQAEPPRAGPLRAALADLHRSRRVLARQRWEARGWEVVEAGLRRSFRRARRCWRRAAGSGAVADFHQWRKRVKDLQYQSEVVAGLGLGEPRETLRGLKKLARWLGDANDLALLHRRVAADPAALGLSAEEAATLLAALEDKRRRLHDKALCRGRALYRDTARAWLRGVQAEAAA